MTSLSSGPVTVEYAPDGASLTVRTDEFEITGSTVVETDVGDVPATPAVTTVRLENGVRVMHDDPTNTTVDIQVVDGAVDLSIELHNTTENRIVVGDMKPFVVERPTAFESDARLYENGYRSSTPTGTLPVGTGFDDEHSRTKPLILDPEAPDDARTSHYLTALSNDDHSLVLGFLDYTRFITRFDCYADGDGVDRLSAVCPADGVTLAPGEHIESAPLRIDPTNDVPTALEAIAAESGERMDARVAEEPATGWCSWYAYYQDVTQEDVLENVAAIGEAELPLDVVQLDDGYQASWGDWLTLNDQFDDLERLREDIEASGHTPGIWVSPFLVFGDSRLADEHPEWLVDCDESLTRWAVSEDDDTRRYALDTTHPEAQQWLRDVFDTIVTEWGYDFLKLDFTFMAAFPGERYAADVTRAEAYRRGYEIIREACGDDVTIMSVDLTGTTIGLADIMRVGQDARHWWDTPPDGVLLGEHSGGGMRNDLRNTLNRQFLHRHWWITDPDQQLFGVSKTAGGTGQDERTDPEKRSFAAVVALTGGINLVGDVIAELDDEERDLLRRTLPPVEGGSVEDLGEARFPDRLSCERPADRAVTVAAFNWADESRTVAVDPGEYGIDDAVCWDGWENDAFTPNGEISREVPPHGCALLLIQELRDRPQVLGSPDHLSNGASQLARVEWNEETETLTVDLSDADGMTVAVSEPEGWMVDADRRIEGTALVNVEPGTNRIVASRQPE